MVGLFQNVLVVMKQLIESMTQNKLHVYVKAVMTLDWLFVHVLLDILKATIINVCNVRIILTTVKNV